MSAAAAVDVLPEFCTIYVRISLDQRGDALGVARQEKSCRELAERLGWTVAEVITDNDESAITGKRPGYRKLISQIRSGDVTKLLAYHNDRLLRQPRELEDLIDYCDGGDVQIKTVAAGDFDLNTSIGRTFARTVIAFARGESDRIGERMKAKQSELRKSGKVHGGVLAYGYSRSDTPGVLVVNDDEAAVVREAAERVLAGESLSSVAHDFNLRGIETRRGGNWQSTTISRMLKNPLLAGWVTYEGEIVERGEHDAVVTEAVHQRLRALLSGKPRGAQPRAYLLAGIAFCGGIHEDGRPCKNPLVSHSTKQRPKKDGSARPRFRGYVCRGGKGGGCGTVSCSANGLDDVVVGNVLEALRGSDLRDLRNVSHASQIARLEVEKVELQQLLVDYNTDAGERRITRKQYLDLKAPIERDIAEINRRLAESAGDPLPNDLINLDEAKWDDLDLLQRRTVIEFVVDCVVVAKTDRRGRSFDESRVSIEWR